MGKTWNYNMFDEYITNAVKHFNAVIKIKTFDCILPFIIYINMERNKMLIERLNQCKTRLKSGGSSRDEAFIFR